MESHDNRPRPIDAPIAPPAQRTYAVGQGAGISWGRYNINTDAITSYYTGLGSLVSDGISMWSNLQKLQLEKLKWDYAMKREKGGLEVQSLFDLQSRGLHYFGNYIPYDYRRNN